MYPLIMFGSFLFSYHYMGHSLWAFAFLFVGIVMLYAWPTWIAFRKNSNWKYIIFLVNILAGWTVFAWIAAMVMAVTSENNKNLAARHFAETMGKLKDGIVDSENSTNHALEDSK